MYYAFILYEHFALHSHTRDIEFGAVSFDVESLVLMENIHARKRFAYTSSIEINEGKEFGQIFPALELLSKSNECFGVNY